jgi:hypothetical protein
MHPCQPPRFRGKFLIAFLFCGAAICGFGVAQLEAAKPQIPWPDRILIGRRTYFDIGPPFEYFEIFSIEATGEGDSQIERVQLTPSGDVCREAPEVETASARINKSVQDLLSRKNPCAIPPRDLNRERKRCKKCLNFSGVDVIMEAACGTENRRMRIEVLDRDMFDAAPTTPEHTSWTMRLLSQLDGALGSRVVDRPLFVREIPEKSLKPDPIRLLSDVEKGELDALFQNGAYKPSELYRESRILPPAPSVRLTESSPVAPSAYELPKYPPIARLAHVSGRVEFVIRIGPDGHTSTPVFSGGNRLLQGSVQASVAGWVFPPQAAGQDVHVAIDFDLNCQQH